MTAHAHVIAPVLAYAEPSPPTPRSAWSAIFFLASLPAVAAIFVSFSSGTSPLEVLTEFADSAREGRLDNQWGLTLVAVPFTLAIPLALWHLRMLIVPGTTRAERVTAYVLAGLCAAMTIFMGSSAFWEGPGGWFDTVRIASSIPVVAGGAFAVRYAWKHAAAAPHVPAVLAMIVAHAANAVMLLLVFAGGPELGYHLTLLAVALHTAQATFQLRRLARHG
jgi:hypothetical protein